MTKVKVVHGSPLSGKSTYVKDNIQENSIVYDYDRLETSLTYKESHTRKKGNAHDFIISIRTMLINMLNKDSKLDTAWIITTKVTEYLKESLEDLDVEYIEMQANEDELLERLDNDDTRPDKDEWAEVIKSFFKENYSEEENKERGKMSISKDRNYRSFNFEKKDEMRIEGIPIVFDQKTVIFEYDGIKYYEEIDREALRGAKIDDVVLNIDHVGKPAAKTKNGTLSIEVRNSDVFISADLSKNATGRELYEDITNGFYDKMSFAFTITESSYDEETRTRKILKIGRLYDVSAVTVPAYDQTTLNARSFFEAEAEKERKELRMKTDAVKRMKLKLKLGGLQDGQN